MAKKPDFRCAIRASFATAFRRWRVKNNIPLKKIAADLKLAVSTVSSWETGDCFPTGEHIERFVNYSGVPPCLLFCLHADQCVTTHCLLAQGMTSSVPGGIRAS